MDGYAQNVPMAGASICDAIGGTPIVRLHRLETRCGCQATLLAKLEGLNPGGSIWSRTALALLDGGKRRGELSRGTTVVCACGGYLAAAISMICAAWELPCALVCPEDLEPEHRAQIRAFGATVELSSVQQAPARVAAISAACARAFVPRPFDNEDNPAFHRRTTASELLSAVPDVDALVCGVGTGGTITACGEALKRRRWDTQVIAVEPASSPVLSGGAPGTHDIPGLGAGFVPDVLNAYIMDEVLRVSGAAARDMARMLASCEGILCGPASGAVLCGAVEAARRETLQGGTVVCILPDAGDRLLGSGLF